MHFGPCPLAVLACEVCGYVSIEYRLKATERFKQELNTKNIETYLSFYMDASMEVNPVCMGQSCRRPVRDRCENHHNNVINTIMKSHTHTPNTLLAARRFVTHATQSRMQMLHLI